jgi:monoamine oxidase
MEKLEADIVIVGTGISGLFAAWRIIKWQEANNEPAKKIILLEKLPKTGGRLDTDVVKMKGIDGEDYKVKVEEGGMRFNDTMGELYKLFTELEYTFANGKIVPFNMADPNGRFYLRGNGFTQQEATDSKQNIWSDFYNLKPQEKGQGPGALVREVLNAILLAPENAKRLTSCQREDVNSFPETPDDWSAFRNEFTYKGTVINNWGLWAILITYGMSTEAITFITKSIGFTGPVDQNINAGEQLQILCDFPTDPTFFTLNAGFESLPNDLLKIIEQDRIGEGNATVRGEILLNTRATAVFKAENKRIVVACTKSEDGESEIEIEIECNQLLLTIPKLALSELLASSKNLPPNEKLRDSLSQLQSMRLAKINCYYNTRWWHQGVAPICHGGSFTDLPVGAAYVFDPIYPNLDSAEYQAAANTEEEVTDTRKLKTDILLEYNEAYQGPSALTVYCDYDNTTFWHQLQNIGKPYRDTPPTPKYSDSATDTLVDELHSQFKLLFARNDVPMPQMATFRLWGNNEHGYGYHQWKLNADDAVIREQIWEIDENIFLSNEAYSDMQGWVNGSLRSTDYMLQKGLKMAPFMKPGEAKVSAEYMRKVYLAHHGFAK